MGTQRQPDPPAEKKRSSPVPTPETLAIRALRDVRKLDEAIAKIEEAFAEKKGERRAILASMSPETKAIFDRNYVLPAKKEAAAE